jgi:hypothetical protein
MSKKKKKRRGEEVINEEEPMVMEEEEPRDFWKDLMAAMDHDELMALRDRAYNDMQLDKARFLGDAMCNHLLKQRMMALYKGDL